MKHYLNKYLYFISENIRVKFDKQKKEITCPFCDRKNFFEIIAEDSSIVLVKNKYATIKSTYQTVLIETDNCSADISSYNKDHMHRLIRFGINHWLKMENDKKYRSAVFYKNHGPLSGGSIDHSHMQIVGFEDLDYRQNLSNDNFEGIEVCREKDCLVNLSTKPLACSTEFNIICGSRNDEFMADNIQKIVKFVLKQVNSYNLFFYQWQGSIICKISPRYVASPYLIGYSIRQTSDRLSEIAESVKNEMY